MLRNVNDDSKKKVSQAASKAWGIRRYRGSASAPRRADKLVEFRCFECTQLEGKPVTFKCERSLQRHLTRIKRHNHRLSRSPPPEDFKRGKHRDKLDGSMEGGVPYMLRNNNADSKKDIPGGTGISVPVRQMCPVEGQIHTSSKKGLHRHSTSTVTNNAPPVVDCSCEKTVTRKDAMRMHHRFYQGSTVLLNDADALTMSTIPLLFRSTHPVPVLPP